MEITSIKIYPAIDKDSPLRAFVTVVFADSFAVRDIRIIRGLRGYFLAMPSKQRKDGSYQDIAHPVNNDFRKLLEDKVITFFFETVSADNR
jgi:stage V sporulation protein G